MLGVMLSPPPASTGLFALVLVHLIHDLPFFLWGGSISNQADPSKAEIYVSTFCSEIKVTDGYPVQEESLQIFISEISKPRNHGPVSWMADSLVIPSFSLPSS